MKRIERFGRFFFKFLKSRVEETLKSLNSWKIWRK